MPDFDRLHGLSRKLAALTAPGQQEPGLSSWCVFVGETWKDIAEMWGPPQSSIAPSDDGMDKAFRTDDVVPHEGVQAPHSQKKAGDSIGGEKDAG